MSDPKPNRDPERFDPRPAYLERLREAVRRELGGDPEAVPWASGTSEPMPTLPAIRGLEILRPIGRGGMGTVHLARQIGLNRLVALKLVWLGRGDSAQNALELARGPRALADLAHPNIIQIFQIGKQDGWAYGMFEYVDGGDLKQALRDGPWAIARAVALARTLAEAVSFIHEHGYVHCDLKPSNILLAAGGVPKIADFGLVRSLEEPSAAATLGEPGALQGTPQAMAPEQAKGEAIGSAVDIHAMGLILYELLTGRLPFLAPTREETLRRVVEWIPEPPSRLRLEVSPALDAICRRCLQKDPRQRYPSARELAIALS